MSKLHIEAEEVLNELRELGIPPLNSLSVSGLRQFLEELSRIEGEPIEIGNVNEFEIGEPDNEIKVRIYAPPGMPSETLPVLVYFHGGGWVAGGLQSCDSLCRFITKKSNCIVVSVDYRLAPEKQFPIPLEDAYRATAWVNRHAEEINADPDRVAVGGDSAGGNLAASVALLARERNDFELTHQLLVYPPMDASCGSSSYEENSQGYFLTKADMEWFWSHYLRSDINGRNPYASPRRAADLSGLPSTTIITSEFDPLRDDGKEYATRLREDGVDVDYTCYDGMIHGFFRRVNDMEVARKAVTSSCERLSSVWNRNE